jgi:hypothetical protein
MTVDHLRRGTGYASPLPQVLASKLVSEDGLASRSLDNCPYGQWRPVATLGNYSRDGWGYDLMTEHWRPYRSDGVRRQLPDDAPRIVGRGEREHHRPALTPSSSLGFTNSILLDATGGLVGVLIGLCDVARFLCCFPFVVSVDRGDESDMGEAIVLDRRKDRIVGRRHCDNRNLPRQNAGEHANSGGAVDSIFHLRASPIFTITSSCARDS